MPIYSHLYSNLARQGVTKTFTHGYAQSVVAATHPQVYASQNRPGFVLNRRTSKVGSQSYHFQNAFHSSAQSSSTVVRETRADKSDGGLDAYFDAWRKQHAAGEPEKEWTQFQFTKRIEWKPASIQVDSEGQSNVELNPSDEAPKAVERAYSASAVDDFTKVQFEVEEEAALAKIDAAIEKEIKSRTEQAIFEAELSVVAARVPTPPIARVQSPAASIESSVERSPTTVATSVSSASELQSQSYAGHLTKLSADQRYAEIPAVFESMLVAGIQPNADAYNALLDAAINLPAERTHVVPKALDVYSDMLRRKVSPNTITYDTLINLLASRSLEVSSLKQSLEEKRGRFGGMEEEGKFLLPSNEIEFAILAEEDRLDLAVRLFEASVAYHTDRTYPAGTYHQLITACAKAGRIPQMVRLYGHMEASKVIPLAATFPPVIKALNQGGDLVSAVECYNEYKGLAVSHDEGKFTLEDRQDASIYGAVVYAYITSDKLPGATKFFNRIMESAGSDATSLKESIVIEGFVQGLLDSNKLSEALGYAQMLQPQSSARAIAMSNVATTAADKNDNITAAAAYANIPATFRDIAVPTMAMLALYIRKGDVASAQIYWQHLCNPDITISSSFIEATAMYAVAMMLSGQVMEGLVQSEQMFARIRATLIGQNPHIAEEIEEGVDFITRAMSKHGLTDPRIVISEPAMYHQSFTPQSFTPGPFQAVPSYEDSFDPYAASTDFKGSAQITDDLERGNGSRAKSSRLNEAMGRFKNIRRAGRHPRYITYARLISAAAREERSNLVHEILSMARSDIPLLPQYSVVRYGWIGILDAMVGACLTLGDRSLAAQYHQELLDMGAAPTANTFGLYITTLKESTKTFDEASEAVKIFHRAKSEGVEPSSFLYNALIGKLGKARRIDDCLFYFGEMRNLGIRPTSVTYGTIVNALCRVSDEKFAESLFEEMEEMPNYKARPAPYNSLMQFYLTTKRDQSKVLAYYERMKSKGIQPTNHTYKLLIDTHATLEPINMEAAEAVLDVIRSTGQSPEAVHYSSLIHAKGCVMHDMDGARAVFDSVMADPSIRPQACLYQALFESMVANHRVAETEPILRNMSARRVEMTPYIANTLIHGWANEKNIDKSKSIFASVGREKREPSTYEAMTRAYLAVEDRISAKKVVQEMLSRGYPGAVSNKILELVGGGTNAESSV